MKVFFLTNIPSPYRVDFFNELGKYCELTVMFESDKAAHRNESWISKKYDNFSAVFLDNTSNFVKIKSLKKLFTHLKNDYNQIIIGGYSTFFGSCAIKFCELNRLKFTLNADGGFIQNSESVIRFKIKKHLISRASYWLSSGEQTDKYLIHYGADARNIFSYPFTSIRDKDIEKVTDLEKNILKQDLGYDSKPNLLYVGSLISGKGVDTLIKSFKGLDSNFNLIIVGEGDQKEKLIELTQTLKLKNIFFEGFKSPKEVQKYYKISDIFVFPTRSDVWGLVVNEAMSKGLPVITTDKCIAGLELIENGINGYIVPVNEYHQINSYIQDIFNNKNKLDSLKLHSLETIKKYTIENMAITIYNILISLDI
ncbi:glycosyltransferase [Aerococcus sp. L_32]|uniref:glycosyltransferase n=1 Tax=Aerococcus sp. L_32 TaxID=3422316 RepID=UPI003D6A2077